MQTKETWLAALNVAGRLVLASVIGFFLSIALSLIFEFITTDAYGERVYQVVDGRQEIITEFYFDTTTSAETTAPTETTETGETGETEETGEATNPMYKQTLRTDMPIAAKVTLDVLTQLLSLLLAVVILHGRLWSMGDRDHNRVLYDKMSESPRRGLIVGLLAMIPWGVCYVLLWLSKIGGMTPRFVVFYRVVNLLFLPFVNAVTQTAMETSLIPWWGMALLALTLVVVPVSCDVSYRLGYRHVLVSDKMIYKRTPRGNDETDV